MFSFRIFTAGSLLVVSSFLEIQLMRADTPPAVAERANCPQSPEDYWQLIRNAHSTQQPKFDETFDKALYWHWVEVHGEARKVFLEMAQGPDRRKNLEYFVEQFGKHGAQADMRWLLAEPGATLCHGAGGENAGLYGTSSDFSRKAREWQILLAELQVRSFLKNPKLMKRYYQAVVWYGYTFEHAFGTIVSTLKTEFKADADTYYWHARNFLMLAHATGRNDLLKDIKPEDLHKQAQKWFAWWKVNGLYLRTQPSGLRWYMDNGEKLRHEAYHVELLHRLPKLHADKPFPDWSGPPPVSPNDFHKLADTKNAEFDVIAHSESAPYGRDSIGSNTAHVPIGAISRLVPKLCLGSHSREAPLRNVRVAERR